MFIFFFVTGCSVGRFMTGNAIDPIVKKSKIKGVDFDVICHCKCD